MDQELKAKWVAALRSGEYKQGFYKLCIKSKDESHNRYCCLGVLCKVANIPINYDGTSCEAGGYRPLYVAVTGKAESHPVISDLWEMNDDHKPFPEIANWIEENL